MPKLICPECHHSIKEEGHKYFCNYCESVYPICDGIPLFTSTSREKSSYDEKNFKFIYQMQQKHFWMVGRREIFYTLLQQVYNDSLSDITMIEIGCGSGSVLQFLRSKGINIEGADIFLEALQFCKKHIDVPLYQLDAFNTPFADRQYDVVGLFDVIEHFNDDRAVLKEMYRICKPGGRVILTVPAQKILWSYIDEILQHKRRYTKKELLDKLFQAGFVVEKISFFVFFLFPLIFLYRKFQNIRSKSKHNLCSLTEVQTIPLVNNILLGILRLEERLIKHINLPLGTSLVAIARKV